MAIIKDIQQIIEKNSLFNGIWEIYGEYWVRDGYIAPNIFSETKGYNPFSYYRDYSDRDERRVDQKKPVIKKETVEEILGEWRSEDLQLHTLFASLDDEEQIIKWINHFGLPFYEQPTQKSWKSANGDVKITDLFTLDELTNNGKYRLGNAQQMLLSNEQLGYKNETEKEIDIWNTTVLPVKISRIKAEIKKLRNIFDLHSAIDRKDIKKVNSLLAEMDKMIYDSYIEGIKQAITKKKKTSKEEHDFLYLNESVLKNYFFDLDYARHKISYTFTVMLEDVKHLFPYPTTRSMQWFFPTLLSAMYVMTYLDFKEGSIPVKCKRKKCSIYFVPERQNKEYCSIPCQKHDKVNRHRIREKLEKILDKDGRTLLMLAIKDKDTDKFKEHIDLKFHLNLVDNHGMTALHYAVLYGTKDTVKIIANQKYNGVNLDEKDKHGRTAIDLAKLNNKLEMCKIIEEAKKKKSKKTIEQN